VGASDIAGDVSVTTGGAIPVLDARLRSGVLDLADLGPLIGGRASADTRRANEPARVFPSRSLELSRIDQLDAHVTLKAGRVVLAADFPFDKFAADFRLQDAQIVVGPLTFGMADGTLRGPRYS
jgi:uncharacterized protein involved in outer membrane biogenesis